MLKSMLSVLGWEFRLMPVMLCLAAFDAHSPLLYSHIVLIRFFAADASLHLCSNLRIGQRITAKILTSQSFSDAEGNLIFSGSAPIVQQLSQYT